MAPPRAYWTGQMRLSLVTLPVRLYAATSGSTRLAVPETPARGGERARYPANGPAEEPAPEASRTIDLVQFVEAHEIEPLYFEKPFLLAPDGKVAEASFLVIREALRQTRKVGIGQMVLARRRRVVALRPFGCGLLLETLRGAEEVRKAAACFADLREREADADEVRLAGSLIERTTTAFDPSRVFGRRETAQGEPARAKAPGRGPQGTASAGNVVNLKDVLKRSLKDPDGEPPTRPRRKHPSAGKTRPASGKRRSG